MTSELLIRVEVGSLGLDSETYLFPKIVVAWISPCTFCRDQLDELRPDLEGELRCLFAVHHGRSMSTRPMATPL